MPIAGTSLSSTRAAIRCKPRLQELGVEAEKRYRPLQPGDVPETHSDISDLARDTGYRPQVSVEEGVRRFVAWYRWFYQC